MGVYILKEWLALLPSIASPIEQRLAHEGNCGAVHWLHFFGNQLEEYSVPRLSTWAPPEPQSRLVSQLIIWPGSLASRVQGGPVPLGSPPFPVRCSVRVVPGSPRSGHTLVLCYPHSAPPAFGAWLTAHVSAYSRLCVSIWVTDLSLSSVYGLSVLFFHSSRCVSLFSHCKILGCTIHDRDSYPSSLTRYIHGVLGHLQGISTHCTAICSFTGNLV